MVVSEGVTIDYCYSESRSCVSVNVDAFTNPNPSRAINGALDPNGMVQKRNFKEEGSPICTAASAGP